MDCEFFLIRGETPCPGCGCEGYLKHFHTWDCIKCTHEQHPKYASAEAEFETGKLEPLLITPDMAIVAFTEIHDKSTYGIRSLMISSYEIPKLYYATMRKQCVVFRLREVGCLLFYALKTGKMARRVKPVNVDEMVDKWHKAVVGLAIAHSKDEADRHEASIEECLTPLLTAPIKQIRAFVPKLRARLKEDPQVPYLVWRSFEAWVENVLDKAPDDGIKELKKDIATEISNLVESDVKEQLGEAMIRALMWRSPAQLEEVKQVVEQEKAEGKKVRLKGRESCLFLEAGGTEEEPKVCIQI